jgi:hypothetical protein
MATNPKPGTPLVTLEEVDAWRKELRELKIQYQQTGEKVRDLETRLAAADVLMRERTHHKLVPINLTVGTPPVTMSSMPPTMQEAVLRIIQKTPNGIEPKQISNAIKNDPDMPWKIKNAHPNYIYTVLMRLVQQNTISKEGAVYKLKAQTADTE